MASNLTKKFKSYGAVDEDTACLISPDNFNKSSENTSSDNGQADRDWKNHDIEGNEEELLTVATVKRQVKRCCRYTFTLQNVIKVFPIVKWLPGYKLSWVQADLIAGLTVGLTVIPQGLAYAQVANLPPQFGMYTAFMGSFVYCFLGTSKDLTLGPTAIMSLMTATFGTDLSPNLPSGDKDPTLAILLAFMTGVIQFGMGVLKLGILVTFISYPVLNAFTSAAVITIAFGQVKNILGLKKISSEFVPMVYETFSKIPETKVWDLTMGLVSLVVVILMKHLRTKKWKDDPDSTPPLYVIICRKFIWLIGTGGNAIVVISAAGIAATLESQGITDAISVTGNIKAGMPPFAFPKFEVHDGNTTISSSEIFEKIGVGLAIVPVLSLVETMAIGKAFARVNNYKIDPTQELIASGVANMLGSFVSSYPITGSFTRTAVNSQTGVRTQLGGVFTGGLVILALCVLTPWFYYIPKAALAAVIIAAVLQMVDYHIVVTLWKANKWDLLSFIITFICSLAVGIEYGILIGIGVSVLLLLYPLARPKIKFSLREGVLVITPMQGLNFPGAEYLEEKVIKKAMAADKIPNIILNLKHLSDLDFTAVQSVKSLLVDCEIHGMKFVVASRSPRVKSLLKAGNIKGLKICGTMQEALNEFNIQDKAVSPVQNEAEPLVSRM